MGNPIKRTTYLSNLFGDLFGNASTRLVSSERQCSGNLKATKNRCLLSFFLAEGVPEKGQKITYTAPAKTGPFQGPWISSDVRPGAPPPRGTSTPDTSTRAPASSLRLLQAREQPGSSPRCAEKLLAFQRPRVKRSRYILVISTVGHLAREPHKGLLKVQLEN